jgi:phage-related protein
VFKTYVSFHPKRKKGKEPLLYEDLIALNAEGKSRSVSRMIAMMDDLRENGRESRYVKHLGGPLYELKTRTPDGGARVYFFRLNEDSFVLVRAEVKKENEATESLLSDVLDVIEAVQQKKDVLVPKYTYGGDDDEKDN